ncbi:hypothetical protein SprV_0702424300 [Sparganum proliferum]
MVLSEARCLFKRCGCPQTRLNQDGLDENDAVSNSLLAENNSNIAIQPHPTCSRCQRISNARIGLIEQCTKLPKTATAASTTAPIATPTTTEPTLTKVATSPRAPPPPITSTFIMSSTVTTATMNTPSVTGQNAHDVPAATTTFTTTNPVSPSLHSPQTSA